MDYDKKLTGLFSVLARIGRIISEDPEYFEDLRTWYNKVYGRWEHPLTDTPKMPSYMAGSRIVRDAMIAACADAQINHDLELMKEVITHFISEEDWVASAKRLGEKVFWEEE